MITVGRLCVKTAGRDAGQKCTVVELIDGNYALIDGNTRRKKCNIVHLEPLPETIEIKKGASHDEVTEAFKKAGILKEKKQAKRSPKEAKEAKAEEKKPAHKKAAKNASKK